MSRRGLGAAAALVVVALAGCRRNQRELQSPAPSSAAPLIASAERAPFDAPSIVALRNPYEGNAYAAAEGQRLFEWYNCTGCHARGGGGMGPALMDARWTYGGSPGQIFRTIVEGTPKGMPAWGVRIPEYQIWQLVTYVQSLSADKRLAQPPGPRMDRLQAGEGLVSR